MYFDASVQISGYYENVQSTSVRDRSHTTSTQRRGYGGVAMMWRKSI